MKILTYKCTLLSDIILHSRAASEGNNDTLDFIPGSCFLGIVASSLYASIPQRAMDLFHNASVRFGDAHLASGNSRSLKIPASLSTPKLKGSGSAYYVHHCVDHNSKDIIPLQLKQCRNGFYVFDCAAKFAEKLDGETNFAIKSAFDKNNRRSMDEQMFGYESLSKGCSFIFEVEVDDDSLVVYIDEALIGRKRLGRSRTAQYGLVEISSCSALTPIPSISCGNTTVYADGRLIFLDEYGIPTFNPTPEQLGLPEGSEIQWDLSQVRTFQYAPYNGKRLTYDSDRCGIEKGSVFVVKCAEKVSGSTYIGVYNNEGFGKVIYNPAFLEADSEGKSAYTISSTGDSKVKQTPQEAAAAGNNALCRLLYDKKTAFETEVRVYNAVNNWYKANKQAFEGSAFASQWGTLRSIAVGYRDNDKQIYSDIEEFVNHGVSSAEWAKKRRWLRLKDFMDGILKNDKSKDGMLRKAVINLSAEMAKLK